MEGDAMTEVETRIRQLFASYVSRYPNTKYELEADRGGNHFRIMRSWICETYRLEKGVHENEWRFIRHEAKRVVELCVTELLGTKGEIN